MGFNLNSLKLDPAKVQDGVWVPIMDGCEIKVARMGNPAYTAALRKATKPYQRSIALGTVQASMMEGIVRGLIAKYVLLDWKGLELDGAAVPYSAEKAAELFEKFPDWFNIVVETASDLNQFRDEAKAEASGN